MSSIDLKTVPTDSLREELARRERNKKNATPDESNENEATPDEQAAYARLCFWRSSWLKLASKYERNRLQSRQERIERRAAICNLKIAFLMRAFDKRVKNTTNPISDNAIDQFKHDVLKLTVGI